MNSLDTVHRVLDWAILPDGPPPRGSAAGLELLGRPPESVRSRIADLVSIVAARMHLGTPPLGDASPATPFAAVVAVAIGIRELEEAARVLLSAPPPSGSASELMARHGVAAPALRHLGQKLAADVLRCSPLTSALENPVAGTEGEVSLLYDRLRANGPGRAALTAALARPTASLPTRDWRTALLERWRSGSAQDRDFVLDVYETMIVEHADEAMAQVDRARGVIVGTTGTHRELNDAWSIAEWWGPLWSLDRSHKQLLRERPYLEYVYRKGLHLYTLARRRTGG
jgi:hypothetical protein